MSFLACSLIIKSLIHFEFIFCVLCLRSSFLKFMYFNWRLIILQYCGGFCHILTWISHGCTCAPHPEHPAYLPPHLIPQGHPSAPALSTLSHTSNLDWRPVLYRFQCYSLRSLTNLYFCPAVVTLAACVGGFQCADTVLRILCSFSHITPEQQWTCEADSVLLLRREKLVSGQAGRQAF